MNLLDKIRAKKVQCKRLGDVCEFKRGQTITKKDVIKGDIPVKEDVKYVIFIKMKNIILQENCIFKNNLRLIKYE